MAAQLEGTGLDSLKECRWQCLHRDQERLAVNRAGLAPLRYGTANVGDVAVASRKAFEHAAAGDFGDAPTPAPSIRGLGHRPTAHTLWNEDEDQPLTLTKP